MAFFPRCTVLVEVLLDDQKQSPVTGAPITPGVIASWTAIPRSVEINRNSARQADTCSITLDYRDFPLDPRIVKDMFVSVCMDDTRSADVDLVPFEIPSAPGLPPITNFRFKGRVDEPKATLGESEQTVTLECRDYTGIWLDFRWPKAIKIPGGPDVPSIPTPPGTLLGDIVEMMRLKITPTLAPAFYPDAAVAFSDVFLQTGAATFVAEKDDNAWDVLSALCDLFGVVPVFDLDQLTIRTATFPGSQHVIMEYGSNVSRLEFSRNLKAVKSKQVKIVAWNAELGQSVFAEWPTTADILSGATRLGPGGTPNKPAIEQVVYHLAGPYTPPTLLLLAQNVYAELSQSQLKGSIETCEMVDMLGGSLTGLANSDQITVRIGTSDMASIANMSSTEAVAFLSNPQRVNHLPPVVALALVSAWTQAQSLSVTFAILECVHRWNRDSAPYYTLTVNFRDFVLGV